MCKGKQTKNAGPCHAIHSRRNVYSNNIFDPQIVKHAHVYGTYHFRDEWCLFLALVIRWYWRYQLKELIVKTVHDSCPQVNKVIAIWIAFTMSRMKSVLHDFTNRKIWMNIKVEMRAYFFTLESQKKTQTALDAAIKYPCKKRNASNCFLSQRLEKKYLSESGDNGEIIFKFILT